jgi:hypothetical protein
MDMAIGRHGWLHVLGRFSSNIASCYSRLASKCGLESNVLANSSGCTAAVSRWLWLTGYASSMRLYDHPCNCAGSRCPMVLVCPAYRLYLGESASWLCEHSLLLHTAFCSLAFSYIIALIAPSTIGRSHVAFTHICQVGLWHGDDACAMHLRTAFHHGPQHCPPKDDRSPSTSPSSAL